MNTLDSVVDALARDPARKFVVVEQVSGALTCRLQVTALVLHRPPLLCFVASAVTMLACFLCSQSLVRYLC
jgi:hypothetical protein